MAFQGCLDLLIAAFGFAKMSCWLVRGLQGKSDYRSMIMEAVATYDLWICHAYVCFLAFNN